MANQGALFQNVTDEEIECVESMTLKEFSRAGLAVEIESVYLPGQIFLVSDISIYTRIRKEYPEATIYTPRELSNLLRGRASIDDIDRIHRAKRAFPGSKLQTINHRKGVTV